MSDAAVFWEYAKYSVVLLAAAAIVNGKRIDPGRVQKLGFIYFILFLPSVLLTIQTTGFSDLTRQLVSFNLSGPLCTAFCVSLFSRQSPTLPFLRNILSVLVISVSAVASAVLWGILNKGEINFGGFSNFATSGGFGPNQVSAVLGLGALAAFVYLFIEERKTFRILSASLGFWFLLQAVLTFSRGGVLNLVLASSMFLAHALVDKRQRRLAILVVFAVATAGPYLILPRIDNYTGGAFGERYTDFSTTGRGEIAKADLEIFLEHPVLGVGPGMAEKLRKDAFVNVSAHTEFSRALSEHGLLGLLAIAVLFSIGFIMYFRAPLGFPRAWVASFATWSFVEMAHAAMRLSVISVVFGLALLHWVTRSSRNRP